MCGIFGMFGEFSPADRAAVVPHAVRLLHHRGPDDFGSLDVGAGVLVNRRLAIVDLHPTGHQPMASHDGRLAITFNGEIYNHVELRDELAPYPFRGSSDTEVILAAYARWGDACLERLRGMFALALWDAARQRLLCATDRLSIKPLLYYVSPGRLVFSSEVKPIAAAGVRLEPDGQAIFEYLRHGLLDHSSRTLFAGIEQLRPGTCLTFENGRAAVREYWNLAAQAKEETSWRGEASLDALDATLQQAVDLHLRGDVEPALSLSSGLDSQVLRGMIQRHGQRAGLHCFTYCFPDTPYDECVAARELASHAPIVWHGTVVTPADLLPQLSTLIDAMEEPVGGLGIYGYWLNSRTAAGHGFKVLLDGQGSDEAFAGYRYYYGALLRDLEQAGDRARLQAELAAFNDAHGTQVPYPSEAFRQLTASTDETGVRAPDGTLLAGDYVGADFARTWAALPRPVWPAPFADSVKNAMYRDLFYLKIPKLLRFQDRAAMAWSVEVRVPYLDHVLLESLARVPSGVLLSGGVTKSLLRQLAASRLQITMPQPKLYVAAPQREWLKGALQPACRALIDESALAAEGYVNAPALLRQYDDYCRSPELGNSFFVWKFVNLELWYRQFITPRAAVGASPSPTHV